MFSSARFSMPVDQCAVAVSQAPGPLRHAALPHPLVLGWDRFSYSFEVHGFYNGFLCERWCAAEMKPLNSGCGSCGLL